MDSSLYADFKLLSGSVDTLNGVKDSYYPALNEQLHSYRDEIKKIGEDHDDCFSLISTEPLEQSFANLSSDISLLSANVEDSMDSVYNYSNGDSNSLNLLDKKYDISSSTFNNKFYYLKNKYSRLDIPLSDIISQEDIKEGYDSDYYNSILNDILANSNGERDKVVNAAMFMSSIFPHLPYYWGGGHFYDQEGVDPSWGTGRVVTSPGDETTNTEKPYSLDCSGYVDWLFYNSDFVTDEAYKLNDVAYVNNGLGSYEGITEDGIASRVKPGDLAHMKNHVGVVVATNGNIITVSHCSGGGVGMGLTNIDVNTGLVVDDSAKDERIGKPYFTEIIHIDYDDE